MVEHAHNFLHIGAEKQSVHCDVSHAQAAIGHTLWPAENAGGERRREKRSRDDKRYLFYCNSQIHDFDALPGIAKPM
jgi:hypothetical protein